MAKYYLVTDTHGFPWGLNYSQSIDFDLGDNTPVSLPKDTNTFYFKEPIHSTGASLTVYGNHDTVVHPMSDTDMANIPEYRAYLKSEKNNDSIAFFGINNTKEFKNFMVTDSALVNLASKMAALPSNVNVIILSHAPLFEADYSLMGDSYPNTNEWNSNWNTVNNLINLIKAFNAQNSSYTLSGKSYNLNNGGKVLACFCGHVHNHMRVFYKGIYMEAFGTNGASEWTKSGNLQNQGLYQPKINEIDIDVDSQTINGISYIYTGSVSNGLDVLSVDNGNSGAPFASKAMGAYSINGEYPKFYKGAYVGWSGSSDKGIVVSNNNNNNAFFKLSDKQSISLGSKANYIRFDSEGRLRYYGTTDTTENEIKNYDTKEIILTDSSSPAVEWCFKKGYLSYQVSYTSGKIKGKNNYSIIFDSNGYANHIELNGEKVTYTKGNNWINVYNARVFWRPFNDHSNFTSSGDVPQIGITGTFGTSTKIDLVRSTSSGSNWIPNRYNVLIRIVGINEEVYWLYNGRLTTLADAMLDTGV